MPIETLEKQNCEKFADKIKSIKKKSPWASERKSKESMWQVASIALFYKFILLLQAYHWQLFEIPGINFFIDLFNRAFFCTNNLKVKVAYVEKMQCQ